MTLIVTGFNHKKTPVPVLEKSIIPKESIGTALSEIKHLPGVKAVVLLTTCNRCEIYADVGKAQDAVVLTDWLLEETHCTQEEFHQFGLTLSDQRAAQHLARVACSLEAMMVGEAQVLGQVKQAYQLAQQAGTLNKNLSRLFDSALSISKQVRHETDIAKHPVSFVTAAIQLSQQVFASLSNKYALMIGTGEMMQLACKHFANQGLKNITVSGRSEQNVFDFAVQYLSDSLPLERIDSELHQFDIVISGTASLKPIITHSTVAAAIKKRKHGPMFMVDLALPRDIESSVSKLEDVYLYTLESLSKITDENHALRMQAAEEAKTIIDYRVEEHFQSLQASSADHAIKTLRSNAEDIRQEALQKALKQLANGTPPEEVLKFLSNTLTNKLTHAPTELLKAIAHKNNEQTRLALQKIFKQ